MPQLFGEIRAGKVNDFGVPVMKTAVSVADLGGIQRERAVQVPALFDFTRAGGAEVTLGRTIRTGKLTGLLLSRSQSPQSGAGLALPLTMKVEFWEPNPAFDACHSAASVEGS